jgi:hypothetical protein
VLKCIVLKIIKCHNLVLLSTSTSKSTGMLSTSKTNPVRMCGNEIQRLKTVIEEKNHSTGHLFNYLGNKIKQYNKKKYRISGIIKISFG